MILVMKGAFMTCGGRAALLATVLAACFVLLSCASAEAETIGYLYSAVGGSIEQFDVAGDTSLTSAGLVAGGPANPEYPSSVVMARTASGENLYQLAGSGTETIYQYSVDPSSGALLPKSPAAVGSVPVLASDETRFMAVFNPAATGASGQNALYVLSGPDTEHAVLYMFDIDAGTGALTPAGEIPIPDMYFGEALAYSGNTLAVNGRSSSADEGFQSAVIDPSTGIPVFSSLPNAPCPPYTCDDGALYMINPDEMLSWGFVEDPNSKLSGTLVGGVVAYEVGGAWASLGSSASHRPGPNDITSNGSDYFGTEHVELEPFELEDGEYQRSEWGDSWVEEFAPDGGSEGYFELPAKSGQAAGVFALGSGLYVANDNYSGSGFDTGYSYRLTPGQPPEETSAQSLGIAMTGYLLAGEEPGGPAGGGAGGETPAGSSTTTPTSYPLTVTLAGAGKGQVNAGSIGCPGVCSASYAAGTAVSLTEKPSGGSIFAGWSGACTGSGACVATMSGAEAVTAAFSPIPPPNTKIVSVKLAGPKATIKFKGSGGYGKLSFRCRLGSAKKATPCHSPLVLSHLAAGKHRFAVYALDSRPTADHTPAKLSFRTK
jgi:hypothetical protein